MERPHLVRGRDGICERGTEAVLLEGNAVQSQVLLSAICEGGGDKRELGKIVINFQDQRFLQARAGAAAGHFDLFSACAELSLCLTYFCFGQIEREIRELFVRDADQLSRLRTGFIKGQGCSTVDEYAFEIAIGRKHKLREGRADVDRIGRGGDTDT